MEEAFYKSTKIDSDILKELSHRSNHPGLFRFMLLLTSYFGFGVLSIFYWNSNIWLTGFSLVGFSLACASSFAFLHESGHGTAFKSRFLNRFGAQIAGIMHFYPASLFRSLHFTHHRYTHIPGKDPEISLGPKPAPSVIGSYFMYFSWLTGLPLLFFKIGMTLNGALGMPEPVRKNMYPFVKKNKRWSVIRDSWIVLLFYGTLIWLALTWSVGIITVLFAQLIAHSLLSVYLIMEHNGLPHEGSIIEKTRTMKVPRFVNWIMWNMPYHTEHHAYPEVPFHTLPELHELMKDELINQDVSHVEFHKRVIKNL